MRPRIRRFGHAATAAPPTLDDLIEALQRCTTLLPTRRRDLRSAVVRVAALLGEEPRAVMLNLPIISAKLATANLVAAQMSAKTLQNVRAGFLAAVKVAGFMPPRRLAKALTADWVKQLDEQSKRTRLGLARLARYASARKVSPRQVNDSLVAAMMREIRDCSLHRNPNRLHRTTAQVWNALARQRARKLRMLTVPSFAKPSKRIAWSAVGDEFRQGLEQLTSLADLVSPPNFKAILTRRYERNGGVANSFDIYLARALIRIAREWVKLGASELAELNRLAARLPKLTSGLTKKNRAALRQFDGRAAFQRLHALPDELWKEVKHDRRHNRCTLANAQAALAIGLLLYAPIRLQNLASLRFGVHLFVRQGPGAISTLEIPAPEVKNRRDLAFDLPPKLARMLLDYVNSIAPRIIGRQPERLFVNIDGTAKHSQSVALLIRKTLRKRVGIGLTPHQFRHLSARTVLDAEPGAFETVRQLLGHKTLNTTVTAYTGIDSARAARHHYQIIENTLASAPLSFGRRGQPRIGRSARTKLYVPFESWPREDRERWQAVLRKGKRLFDDSGTAAHLAEASRVSFRDAYARLIAFLTNRHKGLLGHPPGERLTVRMIEEYIAWQPATTGPRTLANNLCWLGLMLRYMCPDRDWSWLLRISNKIAAQANRRPTEHLLITSESLYLLGLQLMGTASSGEDMRARPITKAQALRYRDGLIIALLAAIPLRRRTLAALRIGHHLVRTGELWALDIPSELVKTKRPLAFSIPAELSQRIDVYLRESRDRIPGARTHDAMWPSVSGGPMSYDRIYKIIRRHTRAAFRFPVNPHEFRTAAGTLWSMRDPQNVRGVKDLLGHSNFNTTEKFYITAQSRVAGHTLARAANAMLQGPSRNG